MLREQMKAIRKELGDEGEDLIDLRRQNRSRRHAGKVLERALSELKRLEYQGQQSAEASVIRTYLEWLTELPWNNETEDNLDIAHVREVLDRITTAWKT
jgi:ATP-dependent Lon protease